jgi:hypothetical protein
MENKGFYIRDSLLNMLKILDGQVVFVAQLSAEVSALKAVVALAFRPEIAQALDDEIKARSDIFLKGVESQKLMLEALRQGISKIPN